MQDKHYLLRDPEDDLALAKTPVEKIIGTTVPWPESSLEQNLDEFLDSVDLDVDSKASAEEIEEDEEPLEHWSFGAIFGIKEIGELNIMPVADMAAPLQIMDDSSGAIHPPIICDAQPKCDEERKIKKAKTDSAVERGVDFSLDVSLDIQTELYKQYPHVKARIGARSKVDESVHSYIIEHLKTWQRKYNKTEFERPCQTHWYWNLRVKLIQEGRLSTSHCKDVCRNSIKGYIDKKQPA